MISYILSSLIQPGSNAAPARGRFKYGPGPVPSQMQPVLNQMQALLVPRGLSLFVRVCPYRVNIVKLKATQKINV